MKDGPNIAAVAALIGDPARANMLTALMTGKALTATELAAEAGVTAQTASSHLARLLEGDLLTMRRQGRHKYYALARADVATALEALMGIAAGQGVLRTRTGPRDAALREARVCYNHLAGQAGILMFNSLLERALLMEQGETLSLTDAGADFVRAFGIDLDGLAAARAPLCRSCLDWSERRSHLAGSLGRAIFARMEDMGWLRREGGSRVVAFTVAGQRAFDAAFPISDDPAASD